MGLLGYPRTGLRNTFYNFFIQDDWQASRRLTFNIGLRYQYETSPVDANNRQSNFDPATGTVDRPGTQLMNMPGTNFGPRLGFAYSPFDSSNTVIRGAYGIYFMNFNATLVQNTPTNTNPTSISLSRQQEPNLVGFPFPDISKFSGVQGISAVQRNWNTPYVQNWNLNIQQALGRDLRLQVGYVANKGTHIITPGQNLNRFLPGTSTRPYLGFGDITYLRANGISNYNSMQVVLTKRISQNFQFNVNYTWGHALDNSPPIFSSSSDDTNINLDYGTTESDVQHLVSFNYIYQLPAARGLPRWLGEGWQINGLTEMRGGLPINVMCGCDPLRVNQFTSRADFRPGGDPPRPSSVVIPDRQLNIGAFVAPTGRVGNVARGAFRGPAIFNWDFSTFKKFRVFETHELQFRAEFFNIFNTPQFNLPGSSIASAGNFGVSTSTLTTVSNFGTQRQIQFGLRYTF